MYVCMYVRSSHVDYTVLCAVANKDHSARLHDMERGERHLCGHGRKHHITLWSGCTKLICSNVNKQHLTTSISYVCTSAACMQQKLASYCQINALMRKHTNTEVVLYIAKCVSLARGQNNGHIKPNRDFLTLFECWDSTGTINNSPTKGKVIARNIF